VEGWDVSSLGIVPYRVAVRKDVFPTIPATLQCKLARCHLGVLVVALQTNRCTPDGYVSTSCTAAEIDAVAAYDPDLHRCYPIPISEAEGRRAVHLRLYPTKNNQAQGIRWARDYELGEVVSQVQRGLALTASSLDKLGIR
jgi:hypothetical protein